MLALAESHPINDHDYILLQTQKEIAENEDAIDRIIVFTSTGHWFALKPLTDFYNTQRADYPYYSFVNLATTRQFLPDDLEHIKQVAAEHGIAIPTERQPVTRSAINQNNPAPNAMRVNAIPNFPGFFMGAAQPRRQENRLEGIAKTAIMLLSCFAIINFFAIINGENHDQSNPTFTLPNITSLRESFHENPQQTISTLMMFTMDMIILACQIICVSPIFFTAYLDEGDQHDNHIADHVNANEENEHHQIH